MVREVWGWEHPLMVKNTSQRAEVLNGKIRKLEDSRRNQADEVEMRELVLNYTGPEMDVALRKRLVVVYL